MILLLKVSIDAVQRPTLEEAWVQYQRTFAPKYLLFLQNLYPPTEIKGFPWREVVNIAPANNKVPSKVCVELEAYKNSSSSDLGKITS